ncbi:MAG: hypothetical protein R6X34_24420 [Chloroflexota bacterium]
MEAKNLAGDNGRGASGAGGWLREQFLVLCFHRGGRGGAEGEERGETAVGRAAKLQSGRGRMVETA